MIPHHGQACCFRDKRIRVAAGTPAQGRADSASGPPSPLARTGGRPGRRRRGVMAARFQAGWAGRVGPDGPRLPVTAGLGSGYPAG